VLGQQRDPGPVIVHLLPNCPYFNDTDVWLIERTQAGLENLGTEVELCEPCCSVASRPPMQNPDGGDDGRMAWHIHCRLRQSLKGALADACYELVARDGHTLLYRGPSATVTVEFNDGWYAP
jgi:hypothetical protein